MVLSGADRDQDHVVFLQAFRHILVGHVLIVNAVVDLHVSAGCRNLPFAHDNTAFLNERDEVKMPLE